MKMDSLSYRLGYEIGDRISDLLPTLSIDPIKSRNIIEINSKTLDEFHISERNWFLEVDKIKKDRYWNELLDLLKRIEDKYLPKEFTHSIMSLPESCNIEELKKGIGDAIWDSDLSHYACRSSDIEIIGNIYKRPKIKLRYEF